MNYLGVEQYLWPCWVVVIYARGFVLFGLVSCGIWAIITLAVGSFAWNIWVLNQLAVRNIYQILILGAGSLLDGIRSVIRMGAKLFLAEKRKISQKIC